MPKFSDRNQPEATDWGYWIITIILLVSFWPVGLFLLLRKLTGDKRESGTYSSVPGSQGTGARRTPAAAPASRQGRPINLSRGKGMTIAGAIMAAIFGISLTSYAPLALENGLLPALAISSPLIGLFGCGLALLWVGLKRTKQARRFRKYLALIGHRDNISVTALAQAMPVSVRRACSDLQDMLDTGILSVGYLDMSTLRLILSDAGLADEPEPAAEPEPLSDSDTLDMSDDNAVLSEIRRLNDDIDDPVMSRKIDRIGELTGKIFAYQKQSPSRAGQLRTFLNYYLPTTLKILKAYARMEDQGVEGENIRAAKARIEGMMDKVVEGFETQLDKLFRDDVLDVTTDVQVLEQMLEKDGLSGGDGITLSH